MNNKPFNEGKVAYESGNLEEAIRMFTLALEIDPHHPDIYHDRAVAYLNLGKPNLAIIDLNHSVEYQPNNPYRYSSRAFARDAVGDIAGAIEDYKKAIQLDPHDAIAHNNLGFT
jgi:Flp pilus assembly protein TadD